MRFVTVSLALAVAAGCVTSPPRLPPRRVAFSQPHALTLDSRGNLYVLEWLADGRPRKFLHTPA